MPKRSTGSLRPHWPRLEVHAKLEEELIYPAIRLAEIGDEDLMDEALEEHHVVHGLLEGTEKDEAERRERYDAKFTVLAENVRHHIRKKESRHVSTGRRVEIDWEALSARVTKRKEQLLAEAGAPSKTVPTRSPRRSRAGF